jgi:hypothetical protein
MATVRIQVRRGTASQWTSANPTLAAGELGVESDTNLFKFGNGSTTWTALAYANNSDVAIGEISQDAINTALTMGAGLTKTYNDGSNTITITVDSTVVALKSYVDSALTTHEADTTSVHGIADTSLLATTANVATAKSEAIASSVASLSTHEADTTSVHGITNTADIVYLTGAQTLAGKTLTGAALDTTSTAITQSANDNSTKIATTAYVQTELADLIGAAPALLDTLSELSDALGDNENYAAAMTATITGINNTVGTKLATADFTAHAIDTTDVHGITNTANLVYTADSRLSDVRTPSDASVTTDKIADDAVTAAKIVAGAVGTAEIADDAVTAAKIVAGAVGTTEIADLSVTSGKIATDAVGSSHIAADAVGTAEIAAAAVGTAEIADDAVTAAKIVAGAVGTTEIALLAVTEATIADLNVTTGKINDSAVTAVKLAALAVTEGKIADDAVTTVKIADSAITTGKIANGAIVDADVNAAAEIAQSKIASLTTDLAAKLASATAASTYAPLASPTFTGTVSGITKAMVGLGSANDTADTAKPVSTAQATAIATAKAEAIADATSQVNALLTGAPAALNTLDELAAALGDDANFASTVTTSLGLKAPLASPTFTGTVTLPAAGIVFSDGTQARAGVPSITTVATERTASETLAAGEQDKFVPLSGAVTITLPASGYSTGQSIDFWQKTGTGALFAATNGVIGTPGLKFRANNSVVTALKISSGWLVFGDLSL